MSSAYPLLVTPRLHLCASEHSLAEKVLEFQCRNMHHFAPWDPPIPKGFFTLSHQLQRLEESALLFERGESFRWWLCVPEAEQSTFGGGTEVLNLTVGQVIGTVNISQVSRGPFQNGTLGYALDERWQGQGLMHEAVEAAIHEAFSERINLHRLQAAWRPENKRSGAVLAKLGFATIGLAKDYMFINGAWRDHVLTELTNPNFIAPAGW